MRILWVNLSTVWPRKPWQGWRKAATIRKESSPSTNFQLLLSFATSRCFGAAPCVARIISSLTSFIRFVNWQLFNLKHPLQAFKRKEMTLLAKEFTQFSTFSRLLRVTVKIFEMMMKWSWSKELFIKETGKKVKNAATQMGATFLVYIVWPWHVRSSQSLFAKGRLRMMMMIMMFWWCRGWWSCLLERLDTSGGSCTRWCKQLWRRKLRRKKQSPIALQDLHVNSWGLNKD